jgi:uncharacterized membrane protein
MVMMNKEHGKFQNEKFQIERIALFSDAVFAIAITLLVIDIKVPEIKASTITDKELWLVLYDNIPNFIGFFISFFVIGLCWIDHHRVFRYIDHSSNKLLFNNLLFLLPIVIMPFSTSFLTRYINYAGVVTLKLPLVVYMTTICLSGFFNFRMWKIIGNPKNLLSDKLNRTILNYHYTRALIIPVVFIIAFLMSYINSWISNIIVYFVLPLTPFIVKYINAYYKRKYPQIMNGHLD